MQRTVFSPLTLFVILVATLLLYVPQVVAASPETPTRQSDAPRATTAGTGAIAAVLAPETPASPTEASVSRIENITQGSPAAAPEPENATPEQTIYPGVQNIHIQSGGDGLPKMSLNYPAFRVPAVDEDIRTWAEEVTRSYEEDVRTSIAPDGEKPGSYGVWDLTGMYSLERPSATTVSIIFNVYIYTGGAHGNLVITCRNYDLTTGRRLNFADLFKDPEKALELMSVWSRNVLTKSLGEESDEDMIREGTTPDLLNFGELSLTPDGINIQFQPYQVGPWSAGPQQVAVPLAELVTAGPEATIWPDAGKTTKKTATNDATSVAPSAANDDAASRRP